jgi:hypothetical protein
MLAWTPNGGASYHYDHALRRSVALEHLVAGPFRVEPREDGRGWLLFRDGAVVDSYANRRAAMAAAEAVHAAEDAARAAALPANALDCKVCGARLMDPCDMSKHAASILGFGRTP